MLTFRSPSDDIIARFLASQRSASLTYSPEGITRGDVAPAGFNRDHLRVPLGEGDEVFERAVAALRSWTMFRQGWVELFSDRGPPAVGQVVAVAPHFGLFTWLNACRVLYLIDEHTLTRRVGFAYGTLADHAESGEERFLIEMTSDGRVWYDLFAYSRPRHWLARLGGPFTRLQQRRFAKGSAAAMRRAVQPVQPDSPN
jgi:uncharacterized protein (UPF0548 family)